MAGSFGKMNDQQRELLDQAQQITYRRLDGEDDLQIHFFRPEGNAAEIDSDTPQRPVILFFFNSGWDRGNVVQFAPQALHFVERGAVCGLVEYRTRKSHPLSTPMLSYRDGLAAVRCTRSHAEQLHIDPDRVTVCGAGAGANIAACTTMGGVKVKPDGHEEYDDYSDQPDAAVLLSTLIDIKKSSHTFKQFSDTPGDAKKLSLSNLVDHSSKSPILMIHGTEDHITVLEDAQNFVEKMERRKGYFEFHAFEGRDSNFFNLNMDPTSFEASLNLIDRFLVSHAFLEEDDNPNGASLVSWREQDF